MRRSRVSDYLITGSEKATEKSKASIGNRLMEALSAGDDEAKWTRFRWETATLVLSTIDANFDKTDHFLVDWSIQNCRNFCNFREKSTFHLIKAYFSFPCFTLTELFN